MEKQSRNLNVAKTSDTSTKVWFITGTSRGFGRIWATAALERGDKVAATARSLASIEDLKTKFGTNVMTLELDVTKPEQAKSAMQQAYDNFGRIDVIVNNAGYALVGTIEEADAEDVKALYETNVFGALSVIKAALPILREQGHGHIVGISSSLGHLTLPIIGYYCSSKWAFEAIHESLATEVRPFGIKVTIVEPGAYATEFGSPDSLRFSQELDIYRTMKTEFFDVLKSTDKGDPEATREAILKVVDAVEPPLRFFLGSHNLAQVRATYAERLATWEAWADISNGAQKKQREPVTSEIG
jgi:NADP-dependent 3-hydroxy acid dehydrogenase YdfG